ncbi:MAG: ion channel [Deltaproteobacteria bacterium]|nr:ion channel [Deltaproteobacteria bacterium]
MADPPARNARFVRPETIQRIGATARSTDVYHYLLTASWWRVALLILLGYLLINALFAALYYLDPNALDGAVGRRYADAFFFSVQTMATIGYGKLTPRSDLANVLVTLEALLGLVGTAMATGLMFAKFSRPTARVGFSDVCVIQRRDDIPTLVFRMANERRNQIIEAQVRVVLLLDERTQEGESIRRLRDLSLVRSSTPAFSLSWMVFHPIDETSPLYGLTSEQLRERNATILVSFTGLDDTLNAVVHARQLYDDEQLRFGHRFVDMLTVTEGRPRVLDLTMLHRIEPEPIHTPLTHSEANTSSK